jgi:hypothetical protein
MGVIYKVNNAHWMKLQNLCVRLARIDLCADATDGAGTNNTSLITIIDAGSTTIKDIIKGKLSLN